MGLISYGHWSSETAYCIRLYALRQRARKLNIHLISRRMPVKFSAWFAVLLRLWPWLPQACRILTHRRFLLDGNSKEEKMFEFMMLFAFLLAATSQILPEKPSAN
jgi:hypothetical protein